MEILERVHGLFLEGSYQVLAPLVLLAIAMFTIAAERVSALYGSAASVLLPAARRRVREAEAKLIDAFETYLEGPSPGARALLLRAAALLPTPFGRFFRRVLGGEGLGSKDVRDLQLREAVLREEMEIERGLGILSVLAKAAPLFGLLGTVIGMIHTFRAMMVSSTSDPKALSTGISIALIATEVGLLVALPGVVGSSWLSRRAQRLEEEIRLAALRLQGVEGARPGGAPGGGP
ncbi:MAG: MotA/TolQ/ExbB proton channel family protein [Planctomycetota bacterium]